MNTSTTRPSSAATADLDLAEQARPGHGIPSRSSPNPAAQTPLLPRGSRARGQVGIVGGAPWRAWPRVRPSAPSPAAPWAPWSAARWERSLAHWVAKLRGRLALRRLRPMPRSRSTLAKRVRRRATVRTSSDVPQRAPAHRPWPANGSSWFRGTRISRRDGESAVVGLCSRRTLVGLAHSPTMRAGRSACCAGPPGPGGGQPDFACVGRDSPAIAPRRPERHQREGNDVLRR